MEKALRLAIASLILFASHAWIGAQQKGIADPDLTATSPGGLAAIPPLPRGRSTDLGGSIRNIDPVLDRFTLNIIGEKPMRIFFDERTQLFLDGKKMSLRDLRPAEHASVQTTLDGTSVFAISIHILSQLQQGDYSGEVASYNPQTGDLDLISGAGGESIRVRVSSDTRFGRKGQSSFTSGQASAADLQRGSLIAIQFAPDGKGRATVNEITFLATPGAQFVFSGNVIAMDSHSGNMTLLDPRNNESYRIAFTPGTISSLQNVHSGQRLRVTAEYDGVRYFAREITPY